MTPPVTPQAWGSPSPISPSPGSARDGACGAGYVPGGCGCWSAFLSGDDLPLAAGRAFSDPDLWMGEAAQHGDPLPDCVGPRRQPLVRQGLPAGERGDRGRRQERAQRRGQVLGLARGGGHREHEPAGTARDPGRERGGNHGAQGRRCDEVALAAPGDPEHVRLDVECGAELRIFGYGGE